MADHNVRGNVDPAEERILLSAERIRQIPDDPGVPYPFRDFFSDAARFLVKVLDLREELRSGAYRGRTLAQMQELQASVYRDMLPENYSAGFLDPAYAERKLGKGYGRMLSALYAELFALLRYVYEGRDADAAPVLELFLEIYCMFPKDGRASGCPPVKEIADAFYYYAFDYLDRTVPDRNRELLLAADVPEALFHGFPEDDPRGLFMTGDYISEDTIRTAACIGRLSREKAETAARAFVNGFLEGFRAAGKDLSGKKTVAVRFVRGFERLVLRASELFGEAGLKTILPGSAVRLADRIPGSTERQLSAGPNRQFEYDHRYDAALFWDKAFTDRKLSELRLSYEALRAEAREYAGPAVIECFGETPFAPVNRPEAFSLSERQRKLLNRYMTDLVSLRNEFMPGEETSFTIIAWPLPEIGPFYEALFDDIIRVNTSDNGFFRAVQQRIIDVLDACGHAEVKGRDGNMTDLRIALRPLSDPAKETRFENCVADVNIPAGEVFTSPVLEGTEGLLHVKKVYIDGLLFRDLKIRFENGRTVEAACANFGTEEENRAFVREQVMGNHAWLPMGEFAVGTNTLACAVSAKYGIADRMPILIAEKTGPHFALGDTCYSHEEDVMTYNPDGKAIIARDNEISARRHEAPGEAYFGHHKDITIPYEELGSLAAVMPDGTRTEILRDGRFVLPGTEELNGPLDSTERTMIK